MVTKEYLIEILKENKVFEEGDFTLASSLLLPVRKAIIMSI